MPVAIPAPKTNLTTAQENAREAIYDQVFTSLDALYFGRADEEVFTLAVAVDEFPTFIMPVEWDEEEHFATPDGLSDYEVVTHSADVHVEWFDGEVVVTLLA